MSKVVGLDLGTNSIGWAVVENEERKMLAAGSRIIPMDAGRMSDFEKGNSVSLTADRTQKRGSRRFDSHTSGRQSGTDVSNDYVGLMRRARRAHRLGTNRLM